MIITRTPMRISLVGGGTDMPSFYTKHGGAVVSLTIDKYMYVILNPKFDRHIRVSYSQTENVENVEELKHDVVRESLKMLDISGVEITSVSDIPSEGTGLGSSSAFAVGLLCALSAYQCGNHWTPSTLAESAYNVETNFCGHATGKQDQYAAAYGGLHLYEFCMDGSVRVNPYGFLDEELCYLMQRVMLFWTGRTRKAKTILVQQDVNLRFQPDVVQSAMKMKEITYEFHNRLVRRDFDHLGDLLHANWELKKTLTSMISDPELDSLYTRARNAGAEGGKLCGAGGGGFLMLWAEPEKQAEIEQAVGLRRVPVRLEERGATVIYEGESDAKE